MAAEWNPIRRPTAINIVDEPETQMDEAGFQESADLF
jgi:hypothetical protein